jgi:Na+/melibiose symporter-like transporter
MKLTFAGVGISSLGGGLFLPVGLLYLIHVLGIPVSQAGLMMTGATTISLVATSVAGRMVDRVGARVVVVASRVLQAAGCLVLLASTGPVLACVALLLLGLGLRSFWASIFALTGALAGQQQGPPKDEVFAKLAVVESLGTAAGGLGAVVCLVVAGSHGTGIYRGVAANAALTVVAAVLIMYGARKVTPLPVTEGEGQPWHTVFGDTAFLRFLSANIPMALAVSLMAVAIPVFTVDSLGLAPWVPAAIFATVTITSAVFRVPVIRSRAGKSRPRTLQLAAIAVTVWGVLQYLVTLVPGPWQTVLLVVGLAFYVTGEIVHGPTLNALTDLVAPAAHTGAYLATLQYTFGVSDVLAPLFVTALGFSAGLPWLGFALLGALAALLLPLAAGRLLRPGLPSTTDMPEAPATR